MRGTCLKALTPTGVTRQGCRSNTNRSHLVNTVFVTIAIVGSGIRTTNSCPLDSMGSSVTMVIGTLEGSKNTFEIPFRHNLEERANVDWCSQKCQGGRKGQTLNFCSTSSTCNLSICVANSNDCKPQS